MFKKINLFTLLAKFLVIILPFYVLFSVFFSIKIWIPKAWFFVKEFIIILLFFSLIYEFIKNKILPKFEIIDYLIFLYIFYLIFITIYNWLWINSLIYWWRYDFIFFIVFLIFKHWKQFLKIKINELIKLFIISASLSLFFSILIKFRLWEEALLTFGYVSYISDWTYNWNIPNYHWLENSWIKRFSWIFDWPNAMAFFLILYTSILFHYIKNKLEFYSIAILLFLICLLIITYSRSAILWIFCWIWFLFFLKIKFIFKNYKKYFLPWIIVFIIWIISLYLIFSSNIKNIIFRSSSTTSHFDRMKIWIDRFIKKPFWSWLAESGPAYRSIYKDRQTKKYEKYYIPESWFIQQLVEWWIIAFILFVMIFVIILSRIYNHSKSLFIWFFAICIMNIFLHVFEFTYISILLFIFIWLIFNKIEKNWFIEN